MILITNATHIDSFVQFITVLIIFVFVLVVTYAVTRWISKFQKQQSSGTNMEIIETQRISSSKYLQIIRAGEKYLVIAVCKDSVTMLAEIPGESLTFLPHEETGKFDFKDILERVRKSTDETEESSEQKK